jgi:alkanesulfonate monooxygenase SsuD/methylene tetrahydromethanopterin reductase-like flavin-dependent oxidoreductase (luciferase family)
MAQAGLVSSGWELGVQVRGAYHEVLRAARWAESSGIAALALPDHYLGSADEVDEPAWDHLVHFGGLARDTARIGLVDLISPVTFRHPAVYAKTAVTLADMSAGRFVLGLGTGWMEEEHRLFGFEFPDQKDRFVLLEETLGYLQALKDGRSFEGRSYRLEAFESRPLFDVPLVVGGTGLLRTPMLAGRFADELNLYPNRAADLQSRVETCHRAAITAGRDPEHIRISFTCLPVAGMDGAEYEQNLKKTAEALGRETRNLEERLAFRGIPHGPRDRVLELLEEMTRLGVSRIYLQCSSTDPDELESMVAPYLP